MGKSFRMRLSTSQQNVVHSVGSLGLPLDEAQPETNPRHFFSALFQAQGSLSFGVSAVSHTTSVWMLTAVELAINGQRRSME